MNVLSQLRTLQLIDGYGEVRADETLAQHAAGKTVMADHLSERDELTLRTLACIERTTLAEQRRRALAAYAQQARRDENVAEIVRLMLASRRKRDNRDGGSKVVRLETRRG